MKKFGKTLQRYRHQDGVARTIRHHQKPYSIDETKTAHSHKSVSKSYLEYVRNEFGVSKSFLENANQTFKSELKLEESKLKFHKSKKILNTRVMSYQQTYLGLPVWRSGISVRMYDDLRTVVSSSSTVQGKVHLSYLGVDDQLISSAKNNRKLTPLKNKIADNFKSIKTTLRRLSKMNKARLGEIQKSEVLIYRYVAKDRIESHGNEEGEPHFKVGAKPKGVKNNTYRLCREVFFNVAIDQWKDAGCRVIIDIETNQILYFRTAIHATHGEVFATDPVRLSGDATLQPNSPVVNLDAWKSSVELLGLDVPAAGAPQTLTGEFITMSEIFDPVAAGPSEIVGDDFDYSADTDGFAAVSAYHHLDSLYRMVEEFGMLTTDYFAGTNFPIPVDFRGSTATTNAFHQGNDPTGETLRFVFGLADQAESVGYSVDRAAVIHEFAHSCLQNNIFDGKFTWCHGFGDALAVVLCDPDSNAPDRFTRSPFIPNSAGARRHDRDPALGWAWGGSLNVVSTMQTRQILSSSVFRAYQCTGGDDSHWNATTRLDRRTFAARYMAFLMIGAVGTMTEIAQPAGAEDFATSMMDFDVTNPDFEGHPGGAFHKVIRWAFEKQGAYKLPGMPADGIGAAPDVDVYIDDGRDGEYEFQQNFWNTTDIWSSQVNDSTVGHQTPLIGVTNYFWVKIKNRGQSQAQNVTVKSYHCEPGTGLVWPTHWSPMTTPEIIVGTLDAGTEEVVGPFEWTPTHVGHECLLTSVSADGDESNADTVLGDIPHYRLVPFDNNIAQRNVSPEEPDPDALAESLTDRNFVVRNPFDRSVTAELETILPEILRKNGWKIKFNNPGGSKIKLAPNGTQQVSFTLVPGKSFKKSEISKNGDQIEIHTLMDSKLIGGMTYLVDRNLKRRLPELPKMQPSKDCVAKAQALIECLGVKDHKVKTVKIIDHTLTISFK